MRVKTVIIILLTVLILSSCATHRAIIERPTRPTLEYVETDIPLAAQRNMLSLISYIERLEVVVDAYESMID